MRSLLSLISSSLMAVVVLHSCALRQETTDDSSASTPVWITADVAVGPRPSSRDAVEDLFGAGIRSVISVDALGPPIDWLAEDDVTCVHIPLTYGAIGSQDVDRLTVALRDLPHPVYVHCHHGKYRAPAAAAVALIVHGRLTSQEAARVMSRWSLSDRYPAMTESVLAMTTQTQTVIAEMSITLSSEAPVAPLVETMGLLGAAMSRLEKAGPNVREEESGVVDDLLRVVAMQSAGTVSEEHRPIWDQFLTDSIQAAGTVQLIAKEGGQHRWRAAVGNLAASCTACHQRFRGDP